MWQPTATLAILKLRAQILAQIRQFFAEREVLEVETPLLSHASVTDPQLYSFVTEYFPTHHKTHSERLYLQTSPEFAMKRLLANGSGSIYQICKSLRNGEVGSKHNPEFTMLEWYRVGFDLTALMNEMDELLQFILHEKPAERISYEKLFQHYCQINPHTATLNDLQQSLLKHEIMTATPITTCRDCLDILMTHVIEPKLGLTCPTFIYDYPAEQAALARIRVEQYPVAERFEVYVNGIELANGFYELADSKEQRARFMRDLQTRQHLNLDTVPIDENFLAALEQGLPECSGVALGIDRLVLIANHGQKLAEVIAFPFERA